MGGKTKQSQRTKNNARPSSSSRSAELMSNGVNMDGGLVSLGSGKPLPQLFPTLAASNLEQGLNPEFQMCIKKLNKKDPITRAKALQELCELVNNGDVNDVVAALPSWAHFYKILTADTDRKVREVTQVCHGAVVRACGRRTAPQLKALLPAWLQAQYDDHAPAQAHAQHSLTSTFPDNKLPEVISFCKAEVMAHLLDNLIGNAETVISKRIESAEERDLQMNRIITSSLQGLEYFTVHLPSAHNDWLWTELKPLLEANAFWKFSLSTHQVRAAWYGAVGRLIERYRHTFGAAHGPRAARQLLAAREPAAPLWGCLLQLMHHVQNWHTYIEKKELLVKRILDVLENGGWGDARHLSNMLLPLLAHLPQDVLTKEFYEAFFKAVFSGLDKKNILNSKSERQSWITSLAECLRYLSIQQHEFVIEIVTSVHRSWLQKVLSTLHDGQTRTNLIKCSAINMASLVKYWLKQSKEENNEKYDQLVRNFWQNVGSTVLNQIDKSSTNENEIGKVIDGHILLLQTLKTSFLQEAKKQLSIKFDGDTQSEPEQSTVVAQQCDASILERYNHNLGDVVHKICSHYFECADTKQVSGAILTPLITLLIEFDSANLFTAVARQFEVDTVYKFYEKVLRPWLSGDSMSCKAVVDVVFLLMKYMTEEEQDAMFDTFNQLPCGVVEWCMGVCARHPAVRAAAARRWLRGPRVAAALPALARRAARAPAGPAGQLLLVCLAGAPVGEPLVSVKGISEVVQTLSEAISLPTSPTLEASAALASRLASTLQEHSASQHYAQLVQGLFQLNILVPRGDSRLSVDTWCEVRSSWQDGVAALPERERELFLSKAGEFLHRQLFDNIENLNISKIENIVSPCGDIFNRGGDAKCPEDLSEIVAFTQKLLELPEPEAGAVELCALRYECVTSQLCCLHDGSEPLVRDVLRDAARCDIRDLCEPDLLAYVQKYLFRAIYLKTLLLQKISADNDDEESPEQMTWCDVLLKDERIQEHFLKVLYNYVVIYSLHEGYAFWPHYDIIVQTKQKLDALLADVVVATGAGARGAVLVALGERARMRGALWAVARRWYCAHAALGGDDELLNFTLDDIVAENGLFHSLQASSKWSQDPEAAHRLQYLVMLYSWHGAHAAVSDERELRDVLRCRERCDLDVVVNAYYRHNHTMLYERDISDVPWRAVLSNVAVVEFLTSMVKLRGWDVPAHHWDFTTITLCSLLCSMEKSKRNWTSTKVSMLSRAVLRLLCAVREFVRGIRSECERRQPLPHVADLMAEWDDIFAPDTHYNLLSFMMHVLDSCTARDMTSTQTEVISELIACTKIIDWETLPSAHKLGALSLVRLARCAVGTLQQPAHHAYKYLAYYLLRALAKPLVLDDGECHPQEPSLARTSWVHCRWCAVGTLQQPAHHAYKYLAYYLLRALAKPLVLDDGECHPQEPSLARTSWVHCRWCAVGTLQQPAHHAYKYLAYYLLRALAKPLVLDDGECHPQEPSLARTSWVHCRWCAVGTLQQPAHHAYKYLAYYLLRALAKPLVLDDGECHPQEPSLARTSWVHCRWCAVGTLQQPAHHAYKYLAYYLLRALAKPLVLDDGECHPQEPSLARTSWVHCRWCAVGTLQQPAHHAYKYLAYYLLRALAKPLVLDDGECHPQEPSLARTSWVHCRWCAVGTLQQPAHHAYKYLAYYLLRALAKPLVLDDGECHPQEPSLARTSWVHCRWCAVGTLQQPAHHAYKYLAYYLLRALAKPLVLDDGECHPQEPSLARTSWVHCRWCAVGTLQQPAHHAYKYLAYYLLRALAKPLVLDDGECHPQEPSLARTSWVHCRWCAVGTLQQPAHHAYKYLAYYLLRALAKPLVLDDGECHPQEPSLARTSWVHCRWCAVGTLQQPAHHAYKYLAYYLLRALAKPLVLDDGECHPQEPSLARTSWVHCRWCAVGTLQQPAHHAYKYLAYYLLRALAKPLVLDDGECHPQEPSLARTSWVHCRWCAVGTLQQPAHHAYKYLAYYLLRALAKPLVLDDGECHPQEPSLARTSWVHCRWCAVGTLQQPAHHAYKYLAYYLLRALAKPLVLDDGECHPQEPSLARTSWVHCRWCAVGTLQQPAHHAYKYLAYYLLRALAKPLVLDDGECHPQEPSLARTSWVHCRWCAVGTLQQPAHHAYKYLAYYLLRALAKPLVLDDGECHPQEPSLARTSWVHCRWCAVGTLQQPAHHAYKYLAYYLLRALAKPLVLDDGECHPQEPSLARTSWVHCRWCAVGTLQQPAHHAYKYLAYYLLRALAKPLVLDDGECHPQEPSLARTSWVHCRWCAVGTLQQPAHHAYKYLAYYLLRALAKPLVLDDGECHPQEPSLARTSWVHCRWCAVGTLQQPAHHAYKYLAYYLLRALAKPLVLDDGECHPQEPSLARTSWVHCRWCAVGTLQQPAHHAYKYLAYYLLRALAKPLVLDDGECHPQEPSLARTSWVHCRWCAVGTLQQPAHHAYKYLAYYLLRALAKPLVLDDGECHPQEPSLARTSWVHCRWCAVGTLQQPAHHAYKYLAYYLLRALAKPLVLDDGECHPQEPSLARTSWVHCRWCAVGTLQQPAHHAYKYLAYYLLRALAKPLVLDDGECHPQEPSLARTSWVHCRWCAVGTLQQPAHHAYKYLAYYLLRALAKPLVLDDGECHPQEPSLARTSWVHCRWCAVGTLQQPAHHAYKYLAYYLLRALAKPLVLDDGECHPQEPSLARTSWVHCRWCAVGTLQQPAHHAYKYLAYYLLRALAKPLVLDDGECHPQEPSLARTSWVHCRWCAVGTLQQPAHHAYKYLAYYLLRALAKPLVLDDGECHPQEPSLARTSWVHCRWCAVGTLQQPAHHAYKYLAYYLLRALAKPLVLDDGECHPQEPSLARTSWVHCRWCAVGTLQQPAHHAYKYLAYYLLRALAKPLVLDDGECHPQEPSLARTSWVHCRWCAVGTLQQPAHHAYKYLAYYLLRALAKPLVLDDGECHPQEPSLARTSWVHCRWCAVGTLQQPAHHAYKYLAYYLLRALAKPLVLDDGECHPQEPSLARTSWVHCRWCAVGTLQQPAHHAYKYLAYYLLRALAKPLVLDDGECHPQEPSLARTSWVHCRWCAVGTLQQPAHHAYKYLAYYLLRALAKPLVLDDGECHPQEPSLARTSWVHCRWCAVGTLQQPAHHAYKYLAYYLLRALAKPLVLDDGECHPQEPSLARTSWVHCRWCAVGTLQQPAHHAYKYLAYYLLRALAKPLVLDDGECHPQEPSLARTSWVHCRWCAVGTLQQPAHHAYKYLAYYLLRALAKPLVLDDGECHPQEPSLARTSWVHCRWCAVGTLQQPAHHAYKYLAYYLLRALAKPLVLDDGECHPQEPSLARTSWVHCRWCAVGTLQQPAHHAYKYLAYYLLRALAKPLVLDDGECHPQEPSLARTSWVHCRWCAVGTLQQPAHHAYKYLAYYLLRALAKPLVLDDGECHPQEPSLARTSWVHCRWCAVGTLQQPAHHAYKYLAYYLLRALAKPLVLDDAEKLSQWSEDSLGDGDEEKERPQFSLDHFHDAFSHLQEIVEAALSTIILGEATCEIVAMSDSYSMALGWLLLAEIIATVCKLTRGDLTHHYIQIYRERKYAEPLITAALRLLPDEVFLFASDSSDTAAAPPHYSDMFITVKDFSVHEAARGSDVCALACRSVFSTLCGAGCGPARGWWGAAPARAARLLERLVRAYVAPAAAHEQLLSLHQRAAEIDDTEIRIAWSSSEVTCVYNVEERFIELRVWLSPAHPLTPPRLAAPHTVGPGSNTHWVALYLAYQNGTLLNALKMWTQAVSAKVESSPQCYICYCRLHPNTGRLPRVLCYQCKNRFHNMCLRKWFTTSNKSNCPLCRSNF